MHSGIFMHRNALAGGDFAGTVYDCGLGPAMASLSTALEQANALGLYNNSIVVTAQAYYDSIAAVQVSDCAGVEQNLNSYYGNVAALVAQNTPKGSFTVMNTDGGTVSPGNPPAPPSVPAFIPSALVQAASGLPSWALPAIAIGAGALVLSVVAGFAFKK